MTGIEAKPITLPGRERVLPSDLGYVMAVAYSNLVGGAAERIADELEGRGIAGYVLGGDDEGEALRLSGEAARCLLTEGKASENLAVAAFMLACRQERSESTPELTVGRIVAALTNDIVARTEGALIDRGFEPEIRSGLWAVSYGDSAPAFCVRTASPDDLAALACVDGVEDGRKEWAAMNVGVEGDPEYGYVALLPEGTGWSAVAVKRVAEDAVQPDTPVYDSVEAAFPAATLRAFTFEDGAGDPEPEASGDNVVMLARSAPRL